MVGGHSDAVSLDRFLHALHGYALLTHPLDAIPNFFERNDVLNGNPATSCKNRGIFCDAQLPSVGVEQAPAFGLLVDAQQITTPEATREQKFDGGLSTSGSTPAPARRVVRSRWMT